MFAQPFVAAAITAVSALESNGNNNPSAAQSFRVQHQCMPCETTPSCNHLAYKSMNASSILLIQSHHQLPTLPFRWLYNPIACQHSSFNRPLRENAKAHHQLPSHRPPGRVGHGSPKMLGQTTQRNHHARRLHRCRRTSGLRGNHQEIH